MNIYVLYVFGFGTVLVWLQSNPNQTQTIPKPYQNHNIKKYRFLVWFWSRTSFKFEPKTYQKSMKTASIFSYNMEHKVRNYWPGFYLVRFWFKFDPAGSASKPYQKPVLFFGMVLVWFWFWFGLEPNQNQTKPNQTIPNQTKPNQTKPNQTKPNQNHTKPKTYKTDMFMHVRTYR